MGKGKGPHPLDAVLFAEFEKQKGRPPDRNERRAITKMRKQDMKKKNGQQPQRPRPPNADNPPIAVCVDVVQIPVDFVRGLCPTCGKMIQQPLDPQTAQKLERRQQVGATCECGQRLAVSLPLVIGTTQWPNAATRDRLRRGG